MTSKWEEGRDKLVGIRQCVTLQNVIVFYFYTVVQTLEWEQLQATNTIKSEQLKWLF